MEKKIEIFPSLLGANFLSLEDDLEKLSEIGIKTIHYDVMDGHFVNDISFGEPLLRKLFTSHPEFNYDVHLMVSNPLKKLEDFYKIGAKKITIHLEAKHLSLNLIQYLINQYPKLELGISISPETDVEETFYLLPFISSILIMSVVPGKGGQKFIENSLNKVQVLKEKRKELNFAIAIDGGINDENIDKVISAGADHIIVGSYLFKILNDKEKVVSFLRR